MFFLKVEDFYRDSGSGGGGGGIAYTPVTFRTMVRDDDSQFVSQSYAGDVVTVIRDLDATRTFTARSPTLESAGPTQVPYRESTVMLVDNIATTNQKADWGFLWGFGPTGLPFDSDWQQTAFVGLVMADTTTAHLVLGGGQGSGLDWTLFPVSAQGATALPDKIVVNFWRDGLNDAGGSNVAALSAVAYDGSGALLQASTAQILTAAGTIPTASTFREVFVNNTARVGEQASISYRVRFGTFDWQSQGD